MDLRADAKIPFPRDVVFKTYRDHIRDLLPYLPNVRDIEIKSREDGEPVTKLVNIWRGGGDIPAAARAFISEAMLTWTDRAKWNIEDYTCEWNIEPHAFTEAITCKGTNRFLEDGASATLLQIRGGLDIDGKKLKGVPGFMSGKVAKIVEELLISKISPNLKETAAGVGKYLEKNPK